MPYIKDYLRPTIRERATYLADSVSNEGELNYAITLLLWRFVQKNGIGYSVLNAVHGVLACVSNEFYRRVTATYEDQKIQENGDIEEFGNL